jgi:glycosyltransferase involved in cell wall biosynthesis
MTRSVDIVIPVLNEAHVLECSVARVREHLRGFPYSWRIVIVDNGSTDNTAEVARRICRACGDVTLQTLAVAGRGRALRHAWLQSSADAVCYMDVDLSTDLAYLEPLVRAVLDEGCDIATGSRLLPQSRTSRSFTRQGISRCYNWVVKLALSTTFSDAQCGFKALRRTAVEAIVPQVQDQSWFFDTELLALGEKQGMRIADIPVRWVEDDDSRVKILRTAWDDLKGIWRVRRQLRTKASESMASAQESSR